MLRHWLLASRPKTLPLSIMPVLTGNALAYAEGTEIDAPILLTTLLAAMAIQIGTNLHNDAADYEKGADTPDRRGPKRAAAEGWFSVAQIKQAALLSFGLAFCLGIYLAWQGGWPIIAIGLASLLAGWSYTAGPKPIAYSALGELFVFLFFGLLAVAGSHYLQSGGSSLLSWILGGCLGMLAAAVLLVNNYRDRETDQRAGKLTIATQASRSTLRGLYTALLLLPYLVPLLLPQKWTMPILLSLPLALYLSLQLGRLEHGSEFNRQLARTAALQSLYGISLIFGLLLFF